MSNSKFLAAAFLFSAIVTATPLTTLEVCPSASSSVPACTVTSQHQPVSTCVPTSTACAGSSKNCTTAYSYSTWAYVSTVIPCGWDGQSISSCTVTKTDQPVPCSASATTITSLVPITTGHKNATNAISYSTQYTTISKHWIAPYNQLGPLAIPGYDGCELCSDCGVQADGSRSQNFNVTECTSLGGKAPVCQNGVEKKYSAKSAPASTTSVSAVNSVKTSVPSAGTYTFTFTNSAPAATITSGGRDVAVPPQPWFAYETKTCSGPTNFDFTITVTKTISIYVPYSTSTATKTPVASDDDSFHWGAWTLPASTPAVTTPAVPISSSFVVPVNTGSGSKYSKGSDSYIGFPNGGDDAAVVTGKGGAAQFHFDSEGNLMSSGKYISTSSSAGYLVFELTSDKPVGGPKFNFDGSGTFPLSGGGFCATDDTFFVTFSSKPNGCKPVTCGSLKDSSSTTTTASWSSGASESSSTWTPTATSSWTTYTKSTSSSEATTTIYTTTVYMTTSTTTYFETTTSSTAIDISADLDVPDPTPGPMVPRKRGGIIKRSRVQ